jgi:hypothetical protein
MPAIDKQSQFGDSTDFPATSLRAVTPHDTDELAFVAKALYIGTGGSLAILAQEDSVAVTLTNVVSGSIIPVRAKIVLDTGTTASGIIALI